MKMAISLLVGAGTLLLAAQNSQGLPQSGETANTGPPPIYYFAPYTSTTSFECADEGVYGIPSEELIPSYGEIITHKDHVNLCVYFPGREEDPWFYHRGSIGHEGANGCVQWLPPPANDGTPPSAGTLLPYRWTYAPSDGNCDSVADADTVQGIYFDAGVEGDEGKFCFNPKHPKLDDKYHLVDGKMGNCGTAGCCSWKFETKAIYASITPSTE